MTVERIVTAGRTKEYSRYNVNYIPKGRRAKKEKPSPERIKKSNLRQRTDRLRQLFNCNFDDSCWSLTLTYRKGEEPESIREVRRDASDFVRRLRECAKLFGVELKFIYAIGAGPHRRHIHITVNALPDMAIFAGCWIHGHVSMTQLYSDGQYSDLADYYIKNATETHEQEVESGEDPGQMYVCSRNLKKPTVEKHIVFGKFKAEPETIPGYYLDKNSVYSGVTSMGFPLLRYTLIQEKKYGKTIANMDGRKPEAVGQGKVHIQGSGTGRNGQRGHERRGTGSKPGFRNLRSAYNRVKGILRKAQHDGICSLLMSDSDRRDQSEVYRQMESERVRHSEKQTSRTR